MPSAMRSPHVPPGVAGAAAGIPQCFPIFAESGIRDPRPRLPAEITAKSGERELDLGVCVAPSSARACQWLRRAFARARGKAVSESLRVCERGAAARR